NEIIENTEENDKFIECNDNNSICEYRIPFLLPPIENNRDESEKNSTDNYLDDGASSTLSKYEEEINIKKKNKTKNHKRSERINIIIIENKNEVNDFEEIMSMTNENDENIEKKLNDKFYELCCKSIADINTYNLNKTRNLNETINLNETRNLKKTQGSLKIEHIDYGDIFLTIHHNMK
ncbi:schizont egress antigen-1, partial [Hepatocystis sp. ex Piliocolobus tephrosceles]